MEENSTTEQGNSTTDADAAAAAAAASTTGEESTSSTEQRTGAESTDNSDTSTSTDESAADDKSKTGAEETAAPASKFDDDLDEWAEKTKRGKPETDRERAALQEIRNNQREFSKTQEAKKAQEQLKTDSESAKPEEDEEFDDPLEKTVNELKADRDAERTARLQSEYFTENNVNEEQAKVMGDILKEKVEKAATPEQKKSVYDYWTNPENLSDWHELAKARLGTGVDASAVADEAARKERERIAKESHSNGPSRNASTPPADKTAEQTRKDALLERWSK